MGQPRRVLVATRQLPLSPPATGVRSPSFASTHMAAASGFLARRRLQATGLQHSPPSLRLAALRPPPSHGWGYAPAFPLQAALYTIWEPPELDETSGGRPDD
ncbi:unnamed protein product [Urochloa humidicola]